MEIWRCGESGEADYSLGKCLVVLGFAREINQSSVPTLGERALTYCSIAGVADNELPEIFLGGGLLRAGCQ